MKPTVAFLGLGRMGAPIATRIVEAGFGLVAYDTNDLATAPFSRRAAVAASPADAASRADVVVGCLPTLDAYRQAVLGQDGVVHGSRIRTYVHVGTTGSGMVKEFAASLSGRGIAVVDAPVTGGPARARDGALTVMASGPEKAFKDVQGMLESFAGRLIYFGAEPGAGQTMKIVNNILYAASLVVGAEGLVLGAKAGLDPRQMLEVINSGSGQTWVTSEMVPKFVLPRTFDFGAFIPLLVKDIKAVMEEAELFGMPMPAAAAIYQTLVDLAATGSDRDDVTDVFRYVERIAGVEIPRAGIRR